MTTGPTRTPAGRDLLDKVPEVTVFFWIIKILATTVGKTAADFLSSDVGLGSGGTTVVMTVLFLAVLVWQFRTPRYVPGVYWLTVVLISVVGTLLTDVLGVSPAASTLVFVVALAATFAAWYRVERTLSIHSIGTSRREGFYWLTVLVTFALGTAAGDLVGELFGVGYWPTALLVALLIAAVTVSHLVFQAHAVLTFWVAYVLTRPLGASLGDGLARARTDGGLGLGTTWTSLLFLVTILAVVVHLAVTRRDECVVPPREAAQVSR